MSLLNSIEDTTDVAGVVINLIGAVFILWGMWTLNLSQFQHLALLGILLILLEVNAHARM